MSQFSASTTFSSPVSVSTNLNTHVDALILENGDTLECLRINISTQDNDQPFFINTYASFSISSHLSDFDLPHYIKIASKSNQRDDSTDVLSRDPDTWSVKTTPSFTSTLRPIDCYINAA